MSGGIEEMAREALIDRAQQGEDFALAEHGDDISPDDGWKPIDDKIPALDKQWGGNHYKKYIIQPVEYIIANKIGFCEGNAIKYLTRWRDKGGVEDLRKAIHNIELLIELQGK